MEEHAAVKEKDQASTTVHDVAHTDSELYKVGMYTTAAFAIAVGGWALICLSSAILEHGGPVQMMKSLFQAITG